jgi:hypothetical protein
MEGIRREAERLAMDEFHALVKDMLAHGMKIDPAISARYSAAERIVDTIDDYQQLVQKTDAGAPDYTAWTEGEKVAAWGR